MLVLVLRTTTRRRNINPFRKRSRFRDKPLEFYAVCPRSETAHLTGLPGKLIVITRLGLNPFRTAVPFWGQTSQISSIFVPKRDCGSKGVKNGTPVVRTKKMEFELCVESICTAVHYQKARNTNAERGAVELP